MTDLFHYTPADCESILSELRKMAPRERLRLHKGKSYVTVPERAVGIIEGLRRGVAPSKAAEQARLMVVNLQHENQKLRKRLFLADVIITLLSLAVIIGG